MSLGKQEEDGCSVERADDIARVTSRILDGSSNAGDLHCHVKALHSLLVLLVVHEYAGIRNDERRRVAHGKVVAQRLLQLDASLLNASEVKVNLREKNVRLRVGRGGLQYGAGGADGSLVLPTTGHIPIPRDMIRQAMNTDNNGGRNSKPRFIRSNGKDYLIMLSRSYPNGERLWSSAEAIDTSRDQNEYLSWMILIGVGSMSISLITITLLVRRIVRPLLQLSERSASLTAETLNQDPIPNMTAAPKEVRQMAKTYSDLMERLALSWSDQRRFVSAVSHELRTPLTIIQGYLHRTIKRSEGLTPSERRGLKTAEEETIRMRTLLNDLLDLSRGDSGQLQLNQELVDLSSLVLKVADLSKSNLTDRRIEVLNTISAKENSQALADPARLQQVLLDLIDNAAKYSDPESLITLQLHLQTDGIAVDVKDEGIGIPADDLPHIFERFYRAENSSGRSGTGLGLSVVALLTSAMGGQVQVTSKEGKGSCFSVILPKPAKNE